MTWMKLVLETLFTLSLIGSLSNVVDGFKPDSWVNRHYRQVETLSVLANVGMLFLVVFYV